MRLWILSDLHLDSCVWDLPDPRPDYDVLVAAGDIHTPATAGLRWLAERADGRPVIYVPGNHEWYAYRDRFNVREEKARARALAAETGVHLLMQDSIVVDGVRFLGATLWTDYELYNAPALAMEAAARWMNDHRVIFPARVGTALSPDQAREWRLEDRAWLERELARSIEDMKTVVVTHHLPHPRSINAQYEGDPLNPSFASDLSPLIEASGAALWVHGHSHSTSDYVAANAAELAALLGLGLDA